MAEGTGAEGTAADEKARRDAGHAVGALVVLIFVWGGNYTWVKMAMADIGPLWFNVLRYGLAVLLLLAAVRLFRPATVLLPAPGERFELAVIGLLQAGVMTTMTALGMRWIEASRVVLIAYTVPIWALLFGALILREPVTRAAALGAALGLAGLAVLTDPLAMDWATATLPGSLAALAGVLGWALGAVLFRRRRWRTGAVAQVYWQLLATALAMLALAPMLEDWSGIRLTTPVLLVSLYNGVVPMLLGFWLWMVALARVPAHVAGQVMVLAPVYGVVQSHLVLAEPLGASIFLATLLVVAGAWLTLRGQAATGRTA